MLAIRHFRRPLAALAAVGATLLGGTTLPAHGADEEPKKLFSIDDPRVTESSGLAKSIRHPGIWWTVNDSGDEARVFGVNTDGEVEAVITFGASVRDVEAVAVGSDGNLYVADIGDNLGDQDHVTVYSMPEPDELTDQKMRYRAYDFQYPDGAHNAETLLVHPTTSRLYIVTKGTKGGIYAAPEVASRQRVNELTRVGNAPGTITDGTFTPDAKRIVLRSYTTMTVMTWPKPATFAKVTLPIQRQGESIAMGPDDSVVLVGSEGDNAPVYQVKIPTRKSGPPPSSTPKPATNTNNNSNAPTKPGTTNWWVLGGAGAFALLAALVTFPAGRRERLDAMMERQRRRSTT